MPMKRWLPPAMVMLAALMTSSPGRSGPAEDAAQSWGLVGTWAVDCAAPPGGRGAQLSYQIAGGHLIYRRDGDPVDANPITDARIRGPLLVLRIYLTAQKTVRENGLEKLPDGAIRTVYNRDLRDSYTIRNRKFVANGQDAPVLHRCR